jgi:colicin import membrane protein
MEFALQRPEYGKWASAFFSLLMHGVLVLVLYYGVQWQRREPEPISVDLVASLPPMAAQRPIEIVPPQPRPVEIKPEPQAKPDIALKEPEKKPLKKEEPKPTPKPEIKPEKKPDPKAVPPKQTEMERMLSKESEKVSAINTQNRLAKESADLRAKLDAAASAANLGKATGEWAGQIVQKVKSNLVRPQGVSGDPIVEFKIELLPSGEVLGEPKLVKSSGNNSVDEAARRAILKSSPLPKPTKADVFQREITLKFHPMADGE